MFDPLGLIKGKRVALRLCRHGQSHTYKAVDHTFTIPYSSTAITRYTLQNVDNEDQIELEVSKDRYNNFHISAYELIEMRDFSSILLSILGTETIGFMPQNQTAFTNKLYHRILSEDERLEECKYLCDEADLDDHPQNLGYTQDGNGHWYMMMQQSSGRTKHFYRQPPKRCWEYEDEKGERLLIELNAPTEKEESFFGIYQGRKIIREELRIISNHGERTAHPDARHETSLAL